MSTPLARILGELAVREATGRLAVTAGGAGRDLYLEDGKVVQATSRLSEDALGSVMVRMGLLREDELGGFLEQAAEARRQLGDVLITAGRLTPLDVVEALTEQVRQRVTNCLRLVVFTHRFDPGERPVGGFRVDLSVPGLLYDAAERVLSPHRMQATLGLTADARVRLTVSADEALADLGAGPRAARLLRHLAAGPVADALDVADDEAEVVALVYALWALGRLELPGGVPSDGRVPEDDARAPETPTPPAERRSPDPAARAARRERLLRDLAKSAIAVRRTVRGTEPTDPSVAVVELWLRMDRLDYFALLGVGRDAAPSDVRIAYGGLLRRLRLESPPEDWPDRAREAAAALLGRASLAFAVLTDPKERAAYQKHLERRATEAFSPDPLLLAGVILKKAERLRAAGRHLEAAEELREALEEAPEEPALHLALGRVLYEALVKLGEPTTDEAARSLAAAARLDPALDLPWLYLGLLALHRGEDDDARKMLRKALMVNPRNERAKAELSDLDTRPGLFGKLFRK